ncbi:hypothetical protein [Shewanella livingstonensis]|uniref:Uncharacterized protein n=1 Tax=Shewanella livingstonensis TaxID=150120 RepID=A0A3G8LXY2_9GAMM|nr:hypothetical protein [Shewanella livingstonensis]AZG74481.1 hypothetical protein EGC82_18030 [Shewanella livingstonensis]
MVSLLRKKYARRIHKISIHTFAETAYQFSHQKRSLFGPGLTLLEQTGFSPQQVLHAIHKSDTLQLISGFEHAFFDINNIQLDDSIVIVHPLASSQAYIESHAWKAVISKSLFGSITEDSLGATFDSINELMPEHIMQKLFNAKRLSEEKFASIATKSRDCIAKQRAKKKRLEQSTIEKMDAESVFAMVLEKLHE